MKAVLQRAAETIRQADRIVLASHINPDGDTIGSSLALTHVLRQMGKVAVPLSHHGVPEIYRWLPGQEWIARNVEERDFDLAIVCDTGTVDRIGEAREPVEAAPRSLCIDHHVTEGNFGQIRVVNAKAAATGELVYTLLKEMGIAPNRAVADCLMCAIITDTGVFRFPNVTPETLRIAAELMEFGASPSEINEIVFENRSLAGLKLLGRALEALQLSSDGQIAWSVLSEQDFLDCGASPEDTEGIVNHVRAARGVQVGVLLHQIPGKRVRVNLRSRNGYDVRRVAEAFGGGGHTLAAGCSLEPPLQEAESKVLIEVKRWMA